MWIVRYCGFWSRGWM